MARKRKLLLGTCAYKLQPKLRMVANGSDRVNAVRAEVCPSIAVSNQTLLKSVAIQRTEQTTPLKRSQVKARRGSLKKLPGNVMASVFIRTNTPARESEFKGRTAQKSNLTAATVTLDQLRWLTELPNVTHVELAEPISIPVPIVSKNRVSAQSTGRRFGSVRSHGGGQDVLVGIIDVGGFDFSHPDFLDDRGHTRFVSIWDQGGSGRPPPDANGLNDGEFGYGAELLKTHLDAALDNARSVGLPPYELEPQSEMVEGSHGTHVASIAAGNRGICHNSRIAGVLIALPAEDEDRRRSFYDSSRIAHAFDYLLAVAAREKAKALVVNISLGTNGHAHDSSSAISRWIDAELTVPGRAVCVAAGNAGQEIAEFEGDVGWVMGRIHTSGQLSSRGLSADIDWIVVGNGLADVSENELEIWYSAQDRFKVSVRPPGSSAWIGPIEPRQFIENHQLDDGSFLSIYNELYHPANGANHISIYLSPFFGSNDGVIGVRAGLWLVRLEGLEVKDGRFHGWIERDDPWQVGRIGTREYWRFPSFFSERSNVDNSSVSTLACGQRIISVANLDSQNQRINITSSQGPTRDGRYKPDVAAPGTEIAAARGFSPDDPWVSMSGTSMASPFVAGVVGLMLATNPELTAAQIEGIIQRTARPLPGASYTWLNSAGYGVIDPEACLDEAKLANTRKDRTDETDGVPVG